MELVKILLFVGAFLLLLWLGRLLSASAEVHASQLPVPEPGVAPATGTPSLSQNTSVQQVDVLTGADVGLPFNLPPVEQDDKGKFNRPYYLNYYFSKTDLARGPADPNCFEDPGSHYRWEAKYVVATPAGLQDIMNKEHFISVYLDDPVVIVTEWNLAAILRAVIDENMKSFSEVKEEI